MKYLRNWLRRRALARSASLWQRGHDFAVDELRNGRAADELHQMQSASFDRNEFDLGMDAAIRDLAHNRREP